MRRLLLLVAVMGCLSFTSKKPKKFKGPENFVFVPSGSIDIGGKQYSCNAFWMLDHEVTNIEYREFLYHLKKNNRTADYQKCLPDTSNWLTLPGYHEPMMKHYFSHPAYSDYPVVNVSREGIQLYCNFLTEHYRGIYGDIIQDFRLPTKMEWMYAAASGKSHSQYTWDGFSMVDDEGKQRANYMPIGDHNIRRTENGLEVVPDSLLRMDVILDNAHITAPSHSYEPNEFGLYNMCGNVAELVAKEDIAMGGHWLSTGYDIRIQSETKFEEANSFVGFRPVLTYIKAE